MEKTKHFYTVGIGASAGGLEALERFFQPLPDESGMAFVIIQHLSPDYKSMMAEILSKYTNMPVNEAQEGIRVQPNHVYLIPPKKNMTMNGGCLFLTEKEIHRGISLPIDTFFHSLALDQSEYAVGVVLSGTGSDGTRGIRAIKERDGMVIVQQIDTAKFDGMPSSAINTGLADYILSPEDMSQALLNYTCHPNLIDAHVTIEQKDSITPAGAEIPRILDIIKAHSDVDFHQYKSNTVLRRIERRAGIRQCSNIAEYLKLLKESETEQDTLYRELLIGVTKFFRDPEVFMALSQEVVPKLFASSTAQEPIRVWIAGCSTGEEAYSLAILLAEFKANAGHSREVKIFATDIDQHAIDIAAAGSYPDSIAADVEPERLSRYFVRNEHEGRYTISQAIRSMVVFARHDLTKSPPFNRLDLISCRNLFIYLRSEMQERILHLFHFALKPSGFLLLGESETIGDYDRVFACLDNRHKLYRARPGIAPKVAMLHDVNLPTSAHDAVPQRLQYTAGRGVTRQTGDYLQRLVIDKLLPPCLLITDNLDVLYISRRASKYLVLSGTPEYNLSRLMEEGMTAFVRSAVLNALKNNRTVTYKTLENALLDIDSLEISVEPLAKKHSGAQLLLLTIRESELVLRASEVGKTTLEISADARQHIEELERELAYTRETLQATIEELETSNEELQSTNEELLASNEELQSTNEELQAVNEELITVNSEYQHKIQEVTALSETHSNLLRSSRVGSVFLDRHANIRGFTPAVRDEIYLRDTDIGRPLSEIRHHLEVTDLNAYVSQVLNESKSFDLEVRSDLGNWYILRFAPFLLNDNSVDGVVLTLMNITERKQFEEQLQNIQARLQLALETGNTGIWELDLHTESLNWDGKMFELYGVSAENFTPSYESWMALLHPNDVGNIKEKLQALIELRATDLHEQYRIVHPNGAIRHIRAHAKIIRDEMGHTVSLLGTNWDETEEFENSRLLQASQHLGHIGGWELDIESAQFVWTEEGYLIHELPVKEQIDVAQFVQLYHEDDQAALQSAIQNCIEHAVAYDLECRLMTTDNRLLWIRHVGQAIRISGKVVKLQGLFQDVTERRQAEEQLRRQRDELQFYFDQPAIGMVSSCVEKGILNVNAAFCQMIGYSEAELLNNEMDWVKLTHPDDLAKHLALEQHLLSGDIDSYQMEKRYIHKQGHAVPVHVSVSSIRNQENQVEYLTKIVIDQSEKQRYEQELIIAREQAEAANRAKSAFLANMSHELRTPLNAILGFAQIFVNTEDLSVQQQHMAESIKRSGEHLLTLLNDVLDLSKIEAGRFDLHVQECSIVSLIKSLVEMFETRAAQKRLNFHWQIADDMPNAVEIDEHRVRQVLLNLLANAVKFTESGDIKLCCAYEQNSLYFLVQDTGIGIHSENLAKIFEPFHQEGEQRYRVQGTGLGLSICQRLIKLMNGHLWVDSKSDHGSMFLLHIPMRIVPPVNAHKPSTKEEAANITNYKRYGTEEAFKLLVVDDVRSNLELLQAFLVPRGFKTYLADTAKEAMQCVQTHAIDLILMDMKMPIMSGVECTRELREMGLTMPIIAVTSSILNDERQTFLEAGCSDILPKPVRENELFDCLERHLSLEWQRKESIEKLLTQPKTQLPDDYKKQLLALLSRGDANKVFVYLQNLSQQTDLAEDVRAEIETLYQLAVTFQLEKLKWHLRKDGV